MRVSPKDEKDHCQNQHQDNELEEERGTVKVRWMKNDLPLNQTRRVDEWSVDWHEESCRPRRRTGRRQRRPARHCAYEKRSLWLSRRICCCRHPFHPDDRRHLHWSAHRLTRPTKTNAHQFIHLCHAWQGKPCFTHDDDEIQCAMDRRQKTNTCGTTRFSPTFGFTRWSRQSRVVRWWEGRGKCMVSTFTSSGVSNVRRAHARRRLRLSKSIPKLQTGPPLLIEWMSDQWHENPRAWEDNYHTYFTGTGCNVRLFSIASFFLHFPISPSGDVQLRSAFLMFARHRKSKLVR